MILFFKTFLGSEVLLTISEVRLDESQLSAGGCWVVFGALRAAIVLSLFSRLIKSIHSG